MDIELIQPVELEKLQQVNALLKETIELVEKLNALNVRLEIKFNS